MVGHLSAVAKYVRNLFSALRDSPVTLEYPFAARNVFLKAHTQLKNDFRECTGCYDCQRLCPVGALMIRGAEFGIDEPRPSAANGMVFQMRIQVFEVNYGSCTLCGLCVAYCPTGSLGYSNQTLNPTLGSESLLIDLARQKKNRLVIKGQSPWRDA